MAILRRLSIFGVGAALLAAGCDSKSASGGGAPSGDATGAAAAKPVSPAAPVQPATPAEHASPPVLQPKAPQAVTALVPPVPAPPPPETKRVGPAWYAPKMSTDIGTVWMGTVVPMNFEFKNIGTEPLKILEIKPGCGCTMPQNYTKEVAPGQAGQLPFTVNTMNKPNGPVHLDVKVRTNDPAQPEVQFFITGNVKTVCVFDPPGGAIFGEAMPDQSLNRTVRMFNNTGKPLTLELQPIPPNSAFKIDFKEVKPNEEWMFTVSKDAPIPEGSSATVLSFKTNVPEVPVYNVYASCMVQPRIQVAPPKIIVNPVSDQARPWPIRVINNGKTPLNVLSVATSRTDLNVSYAPPGPPTPGLADFFAKKSYVTHTINLTLPPNYAAPPWGELIQIKTDDAEKPVIDVYILPSFAEPAVRPPEHPLVLTPVPMPEKK